MASSSRSDGPIPADASACDSAAYASAHSHRPAAPRPRTSAASPIAEIPSSIRAPPRNLRQHSERPTRTLALAAQPVADSRSNASSPHSGPGCTRCVESDRRRVRQVSIRVVNLIPGGPVGPILDADRGRRSGLCRHRPDRWLARRHRRLPRGREVRRIGPAAEVQPTVVTNPRISAAHAAGSSARMAELGEHFELRRRVRRIGAPRRSPTATGHRRQRATRGSGRRPKAAPGGGRSPPRWNPPLESMPGGGASRTRSRSSTLAVKSAVARRASSEESRLGCVPLSRVNVAGADRSTCRTHSGEVEFLGSAPTPTDLGITTL